ncbi:S-layer glycoprotein N-glycosyltransferase AglJ [Candidatus Halobonum tyrrellensis]|uniref:Glycosyltransferase ( dolichyl-phosphate beta-D-mannosyltransferase) n=1 Tax=Candidatus Halobonum tyrrellensis G22 TaxID=1324957 RepID=V4J0M8_9EURY|nr:S-layer glycoprotein N-glycosyltransferase AglJ [Candidatus Halobonum tyrrellensis]ESP89027.1 glycosyltransferase (dolichyl-phosphate beta-D-mannosyltransferase) [Candidatus Halobonum tyrrellensis G22]
MDRSAVCVLLPTYNEAETVADVVADFREHGFENVLVVDGGSTDDTRDLAREAGARVVVQSGTGKGQAVREAVSEYVVSEFVLLADADTTYRAADADAMLEPLFAGEAEHVIGDRFANIHDDAMTRFNAVGNQVFNRLFGVIHGEEFEDILSGYRAFTRRSFERLTLTADGFGIETEMSVECARHGIRTRVVPITYLPRPNGSNTNLHPLKDGGIILMAIYRQAKTSNPLFYFGSAGGLSGLVGVVIAAYVAYEWFVPPRVSHEVLALASGVAFLFGVQLLVFGVLSDLIVTLHRETLERIETVERESGEPPLSDHTTRDDPANAESGRTSDDRAPAESGEDPASEREQVPQPGDE